MDIIEVGTVIIWIKTGIWLPFVVGLLPVIGIGVFISVYYFKNVAYICPNCHEIINPRFKESFWAAHTPNTRRLKCPHCGKKGMCIEIFKERI